ncbi:MAG: MoxR family ATPase [Endomicrobiia bacterium]
MPLILGEKWDTIPEVDYETLRKVLELLYSMDNPPSLLIFGPPGIGKTQIVTTFANDKDMDLRIRFLSRTEPTDWLGIPKTKIDNNEEYTVFVRPQFLRGRTSGKRILFFFDEINTASPQVLNSALDVILNKRVEEYELPKDTMIVAAGNYGKEDGTYVEELSKAVKTRFMQVRLSPSLKQWLDWAKNNQIHPAIIRFLEEKDSIDHLLDTQGLQQENAQQIATPRGWEILSKMLIKLEEECKKQNGKVDENMVTILSCSILGKRIADEFCKAYFGIREIIEIIYMDPGKIVQKISEKLAVLQEIVDFVITAVENNDGNKDNYIEKLVEVLQRLNPALYTMVADRIQNSKILCEKIKKIDGNLFNNILTKQ